MSVQNFLFILLLFLGSCKSLKTTKPNVDDVILFQNGKEIILNKNQILEIEKSKFSFRFFNHPYNSAIKQFYNARIAVFLDEDGFEKTKIGMERKDTYYFYDGTAMAAFESNFYESIFVSEEANHYLYYENESNRRLDLLKKEGELQQLEFSISSMYLEDVLYKIEDYPRSNLLFMIFIDRNLNNIVDENELHKLTLKFM